MYRSQENKDNNMIHAAPPRSALLSVCLGGYMSILVIMYIRSHIVNINNNNITTYVRNDI